MTTEFEAARDLIYAQGGGVKVDGVPVIVVPEEYKFTSLERLLPAPKRTVGTAHLQSAESFVDYVKRFASPTTQFFANGILNRLCAVFDFPTATAAGWCDHTASYTAVASPEWEAFTKLDKREMGQEAFAAFVEDQANYFSQPSGGELLELTKSLQASKDVKWRRAINLDNGTTQFHYDEELTARTGTNRGAVELPRAVTLALRPFNRGVVYGVMARLRYRLHEGALLLRFELVEPKKYVEDAFDDVVAKVATDTGLAPFFGSADLGKPTLKEKE